VDAPPPAVAPAEPPSVTPAPPEGSPVAPSEPPPPPIEAKPTAPEPPAAPEAPEPREPAWYETLEFSAFADAYLSVNYNFPKPQADANQVVRAYDTSNGFSLSWVGLDVSYPAEPVGGAVQLRFGPSAERLGRTCLAEPCDADEGLSNVKQAFATWKPGGKGSAVALDFGKFDTIYGVEVADSQYNINYTRGVVYWFAQPAFHTGFRLNADFSEAFTLKALLVNGYNNSVDNNFGKTLGLQGIVNLKSGEDSLGSVALGYLVGPERADYKLVECPAGQAFDPDTSTGCTTETGSPGGSGLVDRPSTNTKGLRHLIDLVVTLTPTEALSVVLNGDYGLESLRDPVEENQFDTVDWFGVMLGARYALGDHFAVAGRGEYLNDGDGHVTGFAPNSIDLVSGTLTLDYLPSSHLLIRLDNRLDWSSKEIFKKSVRDATGTLFTSTLGVVIQTND
jgi:hypothetical protein